MQGKTEIRYGKKETQRDEDGKFYFVLGLNSPKG